MNTLLVIVIGFVCLCIPFFIGPLRREIGSIMSSLIFLNIYTGIGKVGFGTVNGEFFKNLDPIVFYFLIDTSRILIVIIILTMVITFICYHIEGGYKERSDEWFYDNRLFHRYGIQLKSELIPVGIKHLDKSAEELTRNLHYHLSQAIKARFELGDDFSVDLINVTDSQLPSDSRLFLKVKIISKRGSQMTFFVNMEPIGKQLSISIQTFLKSKYYWYQVLIFIIQSPLSYWFWIYHWLLKKYYIRSNISHQLMNAFEKMDLEARLKLMNFTIMVGIENFAKEYDLLTDELRQLIVNNINNTQSIKISRSKRIRISGLRNTVKPSYS